MHSIRSFMSWVLAIGIIAGLLLGVDSKLFGDPEQANVVFSILAERTGQVLFEPSGRYVVGLMEGLVALLLVFPFSRPMGAFFAFLISGLFLAAHLSPFLGQEIPLALGGTQTDGASLFYLTIALVAGSGLLMFIHPKSRKRRTFR